MDTAFVIILFLSVVPAIEGRYAIPAAAALGYDPVVAYCAVTITTAILAFVLSHALWLLDKIVRGLPHLSEFWVRYVDRARAGVQPYLEKYGAMGLILFVAIPLPGTGVWTGNIAGYVLGIPPQKLALYTATGGIISNTVALFSTIGLCQVVQG